MIRAIQLDGLPQNWCFNTPFQILRTLVSHPRQMFKLEVTLIWLIIQMDSILCSIKECIPLQWSSMKPIWVSMAGFGSQIDALTDQTLSAIWVSLLEAAVIRMIIFGVWSPTYQECKVISAKILDMVSWHTKTISSCFSQAEEIHATMLVS